MGCNWSKKRRGQPSHSTFSENGDHEDPVFKKNGKYRLGQLTVLEGECAAVIHSDGRRVLLHGPETVRPFFAKVEFLVRYQCDSHHYLVVEYIDGRKRNIRGPHSVFFDPCEHTSISVSEAMLLEENEAIVVYSDSDTAEAIVHEVDESTGGDEVPLKGSFKGDESESTLQVTASRAVSRRIVRGPVVFVPRENEWLHQFSWHGTRIPGQSNGSITGHHNDVKASHAVNFERLRLMPDQMYFTCRDVRSSDDAILSIHTMIFFEMIDINLMLQATNDPISDIINAISADIMTMAARYTYEALLTQSNQLSLLDTYPILQGRLSSCGYKLLKVVYRGYSASSKLQSMQESSITKRTELRLNQETREHELHNRLVELKAQSEQQELQHNQANQKAEHDQKLAFMKAEAETTRFDILQKQKLAHLKQENDLKLEYEKKLNEEKSKYLQNLSSMGVDLTQYLCSKEGVKPDFAILNQSGGKEPHLHLKVPNNM